VDQGHQQKLARVRLRERNDLEASIFRKAREARALIPLPLARQPLREQRAVNREAARANGSKSTQILCNNVVADMQF
jgi:hypothetical protein